MVNVTNGKKINNNYKNKCEKPTSLGEGWIACIC